MDFLLKRRRGNEAPCGFAVPEFRNRLDVEVERVAIQPAHRAVGADLAAAVAERVQRVHAHERRAALGAPGEEVGEARQVAHAPVARPAHGVQVREDEEHPGDPRRAANAQLHFRLAPPLLTFAFAIMAVPLARSTPRQARYGRVIMGFLAYLVGMQLMLMGTEWLEVGRMPAALGLWWLVLPLVAAALWLYFTDGRMRRSRPLLSARV